MKRSVNSCTRGANSGHPARGERLRHQPAQPRVVRRVDVEQMRHQVGARARPGCRSCPWRLRRPRVVHRVLAQPPVRQRLPRVRVPRHQPRLHPAGQRRPPHRGVLAQPGVRRVRIGGELPREQFGHGRGRRLPGLLGVLRRLRGLRRVRGVGRAGGAVGVRGVHGGHGGHGVGHRPTVSGCAPGPRAGRGGPGPKGLRGCAVRAYGMRGCGVRGPAPTRRVLGCGAPGPTRVRPYRGAESPGRRGVSLGCGAPYLRGACPRGAGSPRPHGASLGCGAPGPTRRGLTRCVLTGCVLTGCGRRPPRARPGRGGRTCGWSPAAGTAGPGRAHGRRRWPGRRDGPWRRRRV